MYILFEELRNYDGKIINIIAVNEDIKVMHNIIDSKDINDMFVDEDLIVYTLEKDNINDFDSSLILIKVNKNTNTKVMVSA